MAPSLRLAPLLLVAACADGALPPRSAADDPASPAAPESPVAPRSAAPLASSAAAPVVYACPMHPQVTSAEPGVCPICGMTLQPRPAP